MEIRRSLGRLGCGVLILMLVYALMNFFFDFCFFETLALPACFPHPERLKHVQGVQTVITPIGMVCFALSYIASVRASRVKGVLLEDVISNAFPHYKCVFVLHGCFAAFGLYSASATSPPAPRAVNACLLGMMCCLIYAMVMANQICFSQKNCNKLVTQYVANLLQEPDRERFVGTAYRLGEYISEQYREHDLSPGCLDEQEEPVIIAVAELLMSGGSKRQEGSLQRENEDLAWRNEQPYVLSQAFYWVFDFGDGKRPSPEHILYSLPAYERCCHTCQNDIQRFSALWELMFSKLADDTRRAAFAVDFICVSAHSAPLCCGLVHYLRSSRIQCAEDMTGWKNCQWFLGRMIRGTEFLSGKNKAAQEKSVLCCRDIIFLFFGLALWQEACSPVSGLAETFANPLFSMLDPSGRAALFIYRNDDQIAKYLSFAYMILLSATTPDTIAPSRAALYRLIPAMIHKFREPLNISGE